MIAQLKGRIVVQDLSYLVLDVGGRLSGLCQRAQPVPAGRIGAEVTILTELVVREDAMTLYGFAQEAERATFRLLQTVQGVGAKAALSI